MLIAIALMTPLSGLVPPWANNQIARLHSHFFVAEPDRPRPFENVLKLTPVLCSAPQTTGADMRVDLVGVARATYGIGGVPAHIE